jgi:hypothetical protein
MDDDGGGRVADDEGVGVAAEDAAVDADGDAVTVGLADEVSLVVAGLVVVPTGKFVFCEELLANPPSGLDDGSTAIG